MNLAKTAVIARKIHRMMVLIMLFLGLVMMVTGSSMKYPNLMPFINPLTARQVHNLISTFFSIIFIVMMLTGLFMYSYPWLQRITRKSVSHPQAD